MRQLTDKVILTTLPHYIACYFAYQTNIPYAIICAASTTFSVIWHRAGETRSTLFYLDYGFAFLWFLTELILASLTKDLFLVFIVLAINAAVCVANEIRLYGIPYDTIHSIWHCLSAFKGVFVAYLLLKN